MRAADPAYRRKAQRGGREKGCWVYIPAASLQAVGFDPASPAPFYRLWTGKAGRLVVSLYRQA